MYSAPVRDATMQSRVRGSLLGGAIGDALGAPVEFMNLNEIRAEHGPGGVRTYGLDRSGGPEHVVEKRGYITDDTQMTLFTVEGIIRAANRANIRCIGFTTGVIHHAYLRWMDTQLYAGPRTDNEDFPQVGWLGSQLWLYSRRAPGNTCLNALAGGTKGFERFGDQAVNDSKGCGGVMRSAPFGWMSTGDNHEWIYETACEAAGYTHGHPTGKVASGALAYLVAEIMDGQILVDAFERTVEFLENRPAEEQVGETVSALRQAYFAATVTELHTDEIVESLGGGWVAEEALAIAVYAALCHRGPEEAVDALSLAVTHGGDSDSTGSICGNILGALHGETWLPETLVFNVEGRGTMLELADDFAYALNKGYTPAFAVPMERVGPWPDGLNDMNGWLERYPMN